MKISTWNVNGIRARELQFIEWLAQEKPDVVCVQEIKASPLQIPPVLQDIEPFWCCWYGLGGYSGVALLLRKETCGEEPKYFHPSFDFENRVVAVRIRDITIASVYVPNGGKDFPAKMKFLAEMEAYIESEAAGGLIVCGDINVARADIDVHSKERKPRAIGQLPEERRWFQNVLDKGMVDVARELHPENDQMYSWWPPWRNMRQRNIGWRIDYILASSGIATKCTACVVETAIGTSDHAPVTATFNL